MAGILRENGLVPQTVITSSAVRAQQTAEILAAELAITDLKVEPLLYHCEPGVWFDFLTRWEGTGLSLWVGHNPGLEDFLSQFAGQTMHFPTSAMALLERTPSGTGTPFKIVQTWTPKGI